MNWYTGWDIQYSPTKAVIKLPNHHQIPPIKNKEDRQLTIFYRNIKKKDVWKIKMLVTLLEETLIKVDKPTLLERLLGKHERLQRTTPPGESKQSVERGLGNTLGIKQD